MSKIGDISTDQKRSRRMGDVRHDAGHTNQAIHAAKAYTDPPKSGTPNNLLAHFFVACLEAENSSVAVRDALMNVPTGMVWKARVMDLESEPM